MESGPRTSGARVLAVCALGALMLFVLPYLLQWIAPADVWLEGERVPRSAPRPFFGRAARRWGEQSITLRVGHHVFHPEKAARGALRDPEDAQVELRAVGSALNPLMVLASWWRATRGGHALRWRPRVDERVLARYAENVRAEIDRLPVPGSYDPSGAAIAGLPGEAVDVAALTRALHQALARGQDALQVDTVVTPPPDGLRRFSEPSAAADVLMMTQETSFRASSQGRAVNIALAARKLDGVLLMPGAPFSFNQTVGKRERARGFAPAPELMNGQVVEGIGGGVCQVAGTLHAAAFFAGLVVDEYRPHSRLMQQPSLRPGLDTMVAWPDHVHALAETKDLRLRNPYPFPIVVRTDVVHETGKHARLRVALYGAAKPFRVDYSFEQVEAEQTGKHADSKGLVIVRRRSIYTPSGVLREATRVAYPPTPRVALSEG